MEPPADRLAGSVVVLITLLASALYGEILRVPQEYATIQAALNVTLDYDTVLVSLRTYAEELTAPPQRFWLIGDVPIDTGDFARPVIDPSTLDNARWRKCLTIPDGCQLTIERMKFVNRAPMYPRTSWNSGGIFVHTVQPTTFRFCAFDSVYRAIADAIDTLPPPPLQVHYTIEDCRFTHGTHTQVRASESASMIVRRSLFEGQHFFARLVSGGDSSWVEECIFTSDSVNGALYLHGDNLLVRGCVFGPIDTCTAPAMDLRCTGRAVVENNLVSDILFNTSGAVSFSYEDLSFLNRIFFHHNHLHSLTGSGLNGRGAVSASRGVNLWGGISAQLDSNVFANNVQGESVGAKAVGASTPVTLTGNRFVNLQPDTIPSVWLSTDPGNPEPGYQLRYNQFEAPDYAVGCFYVEADAILNYWGDVSGPYNATYNPQGQGARVDDAVLFNPWCPDTNCYLSVPGIGQPLPQQFVFEAYPNPFNSVLHLTLIPSEIGIVKVELFDLLGRRVDEIWHGPLAFQKEISFDASALSSGIYFARVTDVISRKNLATAKVVLLD